MELATIFLGRGSCDRTRFWVLSVKVSRCSVSRFAVSDVIQDWCPCSQKQKRNLLEFVECLPSTKVRIINSIHHVGDKLSIVWATSPLSKSTCTVGGKAVAAARRVPRWIMRMTHVTGRIQHCQIFDFRRSRDMNSHVIARKSDSTCKTLLQLRCSSWAQLHLDSAPDTWSKKT